MYNNKYSDYFLFYKLSAKLLNHLHNYACIIVFITNCITQISLKNVILVLVLPYY